MTFRRSLVVVAALSGAASFMLAGCKFGTASSGETQVKAARYHAARHCTSEGQLIVNGKPILNSVPGRCEELLSQIHVGFGIICVPPLLGGGEFHDSIRTDRIQQPDLANHATWIWEPSREVVLFGGTQNDELFQQCVNLTRNVVRVNQDMLMANEITVQGTKMAFTRKFGPSEDRFCIFPKHASTDFRQGYYGDVWMCVGDPAPGESGNVCKKYFLQQDSLYQLPELSRLCLAETQMYVSPPLTP